MEASPSMMILCATINEAKLSGPACTLGVLRHARTLLVCHRSCLDGTVTARQQNSANLSRYILSCLAAEEGA